MTSSQTVRRARTASLALLAVAAMVLLSGCFKLDMALELASDDTVDGSIIVAAQRSFADLAGGEDALRESLSQDGSGLLGDQPTSGSVETKDYSDDDWIGVEYVIEDVPLEEFGGTETGDLSITREGDEFVVAGTMDLSGGVSDDPAANAMLDEAEIEISITFPGDIVSSNGEEDGNTVTWTPVAGETLDVNAVGKAEGGPPWTLIGAVLAVLALVVVGVVLFLVVRRRQPAPVAAGPLGEGSIVPGGDAPSGATSPDAAPFSAAVPPADVAPPSAGEPPTAPPVPPADEPPAAPAPPAPPSA
jgi:hypothetical protein